MATAKEQPRHLELLEQAIDELKGSDGFKRWLRSRSRFYRYSPFNQFLIAMQAPHATHVAGYRSWQNDHNRQVRKGERAIVILAPIVRRFEADDPATGEQVKIRRVSGFRGASVFDISQTEGEPLPPTPVGPIDGDSHTHVIPQLTALAEAIDFSVSFADLTDGSGGYCDYGAHAIVVANGQSPNAVVRVLIHELVHAHGVSYERFTRRGAETIADSATYVVCQALGLDIKLSAAFYQAGWSTPELRQRLTGQIDHYAALIERGLGLHDRKTALPDDSEEVDHVEHATPLATA